ncbi:MAG: tetratricopeptide repeat protein [Betaproteobacteria bacterium]
MSVLAQVLDDLAARGAAPRSLEADRLPWAAAIAPARPRRQAPTRRQGVWLATLTILACTTAALAWLEVRARSQTFVVRPLGLHDLDSIVATAATPAMVNASNTVSTVSSAEQPAPAQPPVARIVPTAAQAQLAAAAPVAKATSVPDVARPAAAAATATAAIAAGTAAADRGPARTATLASLAPASSTTSGDSAVVRRSSASLNDPQADLARAGDLISRGRGREAKPLLLDLLARDPRNAAARKALAAVQSESGERTEALVTLLDGASVDPARFAATAAQLQTELGDARGALTTLQRMPLERRDGPFHALNGGIALAAEAPQQAVEAYQRAVSSADAQPLWLVGLALAHEGAGQIAEAQAAYVRALQQPRLPAEARTYAQQKLGSAAAKPVRSSSGVTARSRSGEQ